MHQGKHVASWVFRAAAAVTAAALADPVVEHLSNAGLFGRGRFTDGSNLDVIPALLVAASLSFAVIAWLARKMLVRGSHPPVWLRRWSQELHTRPIRALLPSIFAMQLVTLFVMETIEQIVVTGHPLGGTVWLGGPILVSLAFHVLGCALAAYGLSHLVQWSARSVARVLRIALLFLRKLFTDRAAPHMHLRFVARCACIEPYLRALQGRAPPALSVANL